MMTTQEKIDLLNLIKRMETRCDNLRLSFKSQGSTHQHDMNAMLSQLNLIKRVLRDQPVNT